MRFLLLFFLSFTFFKSQGQDSLQVAFYNVENLFDTIHDLGKNDYEFLPNGKNKWDSSAYHLKLNHIARVIIAMNDWQGADIIGLAEVENKNVLFDLIHKTSLKQFGYLFVHHESLDSRGIDVAVLYKRRKFILLNDSSIVVDLGKHERTTRDILLTSFVHKKRDTLNLIVNHWPSRFGGIDVSEYKRMKASSSLTELVEKVQGETIVVGDFNDDPDNRSMRYFSKFSECLYLNQAKETLKYEARWNTFDQIWISPGTNSSESYVFRPNWIFHIDNQYGGNKPYRFIEASQVIGGYSDHLPVYCYWKF